MAARITILPVETIRASIHIIRDHKVMLDSDLAELYQVNVKALNQAVQRNLDRFPADFMFRLSADEYAALRSQTVTLNKGRGAHRKYPPTAFTEQGVGMLSSVLRSTRAVQVNIAIIRAFVELRRYALTHDEIRSRLDVLEQNTDRRFKRVLDLIRKLMEPEVPTKPLQPTVGFARKKTS